MDGSENAVSTTDKIALLSIEITVLFQGRLANETVNIIA
jgi:hypothetical protein